MNYTPEQKANWDEVMRRIEASVDKPSFDQWLRPLELYAVTSTALIIIVAMVFRTLSIGVETGSNSLRQVDPSIEEAAVSLGAGNAKTFFSISLPIMKSALFSGLLNSFIR